MTNATVLTNGDFMLVMIAVFLVIGMFAIVFYFMEEIVNDDERRKKYNECMKEDAINAALQRMQSNHPHRMMPNPQPEKPMSTRRKQERFVIAYTYYSLGVDANLIQCETWIPIMNWESPNHNEFKGDDIWYHIINLRRDDDGNQVHHYLDHVLFPTYGSEGQKRLEREVGVQQRYANVVKNIYDLIRYAYQHDADRILFYRRIKTKDVPSGWYELDLHNLQWLNADQGEFGAPVTLDDI